jgi:RNA polymerase sigma-70 factor (ECF subfamily)
VPEREPGHGILPPTIVADVRAGDRAAFESLFHAFYSPLRGFVIRYVREPALADEVVQDLFAELWVQRARWQVRTSVRAYLFAAARNRALNLRKRRAIEQDWEREESVDAVRALHPAPARPDELFDATESRTRLEAALQSLPERCRLVMQLRWSEQLSYAEIAAVMEISIKGVENQLARGLNALRAVMSEGAG